MILCLPDVAQVPEFALKGGTAINLFCHELPRISVDIDLTYLPVTDRKTALRSIHSGLTTIEKNIRRTMPRTQVQLNANTFKLLITMNSVQVKVEPSTIMRGSLLPLVESNLCLAAQKKYEGFARIRRLDVADLYGGKICAALDRQHPRDLFDIMLLQTEGVIPDNIRQAFVVYLAAHNRPIAELFSPNPKPLESLFIHQPPPIGLGACRT